jgi:anaerobic ribonucleoside-triphosphate reductase activating protein
MNGYIAKIFTSFIDVPDEIATSIYFSGCSVRCPGCHNKQYWERESGTEMTDDQIMKIIQDNPLTRYVAFLGGEPTDQLLFLLHMCKRIQLETVKQIALYTGREFEVLPHELLVYPSLIVCGPYRQEMHQAGWPASANQRIFKKEGQTWTN